MEKIPIVFCFDDNLIRQVQVTVASLLDHRASAHYSIYCVCAGTAYRSESVLRAVIAKRDPDTELTVIRAGEAYKDSYQRGNITAGTYLRLTLPDVLKDIDRIIYTDVDVLFCDSLQDLWQIDLGGNMLGAVKGAVNFEYQWQLNSRRKYWVLLTGVKGRYINAGVTLMDLRMMRERGITGEWEKYSGEKFHYQDQDILNITCSDSITYVHPRYNVQAYMDAAEYEQFVTYGIYSEEEIVQAQKDPAIIHFTAYKPWKMYDGYRNDMWWKYVNSQADLKGLFDENAARKYHGPGIAERGIRKLRRCLNMDV